LEREPVFLAREQIEEIHRDQINEFGGVHGLRDEGALESAIAQPLNVYFYGNGDLYEIAGAYAFHIAESQAYLDGNKRTAVQPAPSLSSPPTRRSSRWPTTRWTVSAWRNSSAKP
jgi:death on curing protein